MKITFVRSDRQRKSQAVTYVAEGYNGSVRFSKTLFEGKAGPSQIAIDAVEFRAPRAAETSEERKARLKALPKPTLEQQIAKREAALAKLREKAAKQSQAA